ncbi:Quino protein alcohol dehydrogenase-like protein [Gonapodya prolifera JEL478]|uniref:Quino protein alcohol dehydrogenase-like protein n=1 Tax=Gonapodya prolifera (strain JEL478) TaxID=1344416 RepID=A0A139AFC3_GONPJ|nr:Quino protein alcohol dehydrogenase-like protein [Gonapodya prolifera JEL478]|eukprot:KXS15458.1 Quino protein alcohol dehydrogenase-like protein [Gonapodya prolifera JEL478]
MSLELPPYSSTPPSYNGSASFGIEDDLLFVGAIGHVYALNKRTGAPVWKNTLPSAGRAIVTLTVDRARRAVFVGIQAKVIALDAASGNELWRVPLPGVFNTEPVTMTVSTKNTLLPHASATIRTSATFPNATTMSIDESSSSAIPETHFQHSPPGGLLFVSSQCRASAIDLGTGATRWKRDLVGAGHLPAATLVDGGVVYFAAGGYVYAHDAETGALFWRSTITSAFGRGSYMSIASFTGVSSRNSEDPSVQRYSIAKETTSRLLESEAARSRRLLGLSPRPDV